MDTSSPANSHPDRDGATTEVPPRFINEKNRANLHHRHTRETAARALADFERTLPGTLANRQDALTAANEAAVSAKKMFRRGRLFAGRDFKRREERLRQAVAQLDSAIAESLAKRAELTAWMGGHL